jgi:hypothetical protein
VAECWLRERKGDLVRNHKRDRRARGAAADNSFDQFEAALRVQRSGRHERGRRDQKAMQLCRQVERAVALALAGECHDEVLRELTVETVQPAGGTTQLVVQLRVPARVKLPDVLERLDGRAARLRLAVASAISRKRVPTLTLICLPAAPVEGGGHA